MRPKRVSAVQPGSPDVEVLQVEQKDVPIYSEWIGNDRVLRGCSDFSEFGTSELVPQWQTGIDLEVDIGRPKSRDC